MNNGINHVTISVSNLEQSFLFYREVLGFKALAKRQHKSAYFLSGADWIVLVQDKNRTASSKSYAHLAFSVTEENFNTVEDKIRASGAEIWQENTSPGSSLYFLDPCGNRLEIHAGDWKSRLDWLKENPSGEVTLYE